jgi:hypothetical protein
MPPQTDEATQTPLRYRVMLASFRLLRFDVVAPVQPGAPRERNAV